MRVCRRLRPRRRVGSRDHQAGAQAVHRMQRRPAYQRSRGSRPAVGHTVEEHGEHISTLHIHLSCRQDLRHRRLKGSVCKAYPHVVQRVGRPRHHVARTRPASGVSRMVPSPLHTKVLHASRHGPPEVPSGRRPRRGPSWRPNVRPRLLHIILL